MGQERATCSALQLVLLQQQPLLGDRQLLLRPFGHALGLGHAPPIQLQLLLQVLGQGPGREGVRLRRAMQRKVLWVGDKHKGGKRKKKDR